MGKALPEPRREKVVGKVVGETTIIQKAGGTCNGEAHGLDF